MIQSYSKVTTGQSQLMVRPSAIEAVLPHCHRSRTNTSWKAFTAATATSRSQIWRVPTQRASGHVQKRVVRVDATPFIGGSVAGKGGIVFLAGATGLVSIRLLRDLASAGFKVVAGVPDEEEARAILDFSTRFELISKNLCENILVKEAPIGSVDATAEVIPKGARVVVVDNDSAGKQKTDPQAVSSVVQAAVKAGAAQVILFTSLQGETGTSFFLFGQSSANAKASDRLSRLEQQIVDSGLAYTIVRVAGLTSVKEPADAKDVLVAPAGSFAPSAPPTSRDLLGRVLTAVLTQSSVGSVLEVVPNTEAAEAEPVAAQISKAVSAYRTATASVEDLRLSDDSKASASRSAQSSRKAQAPAEETTTAAPGLFGFGTVRKASIKKDEAPEEREPEVPKKAPASLFAFGARKPAPAKEEEAKQPAPAPVPKKAPAPLFAFGARKAATAKKEEEEKEQEQPKPVPLFAFAARKPPAKKEAPAEEEAPAKKAAPFFAFGSRKVPKQDEDVATPKGRQPVKAVPVKAGRGTQVQKAGTQRTAARGTQVVGKAGPPPRKAPLPVKKAAPAGPTKKVAPPRKSPPPQGTTRRSVDEDDEEPPKKGFRLFPL